MRTTKHPRHVPRSAWRRALYSILIIATVVIVGTGGIHTIEGLSYIDSFYFISMLATAQGPPTAPVTVAGKLFAAVMAFVSVGAVVAALAFLFGPFFGILGRIGVERLEEEVRMIEGKKTAEGSDEKG